MLPPVDRLQTLARQLIADEYQNLKGLTRYGRSNGLCPYSPYEDLGDSSIRLAEKAQRVKMPNATGTHPYEEFYYFYNTLVYEYNKFSELAKVKVLKSINQPNLFAFRRTSSTANDQPVTPKVDMSTPAVAPSASSTLVRSPMDTSTSTAAISPKRDTVYVERTRTDTIYVDRMGRTDDVYTLKGFATNNMVLLLDVSASMKAPFKLPLLKKSVKSLLSLLRPDDQISIVVYSGKARVALKTTPGTAVEEIAEAIDQLESDGDTDGDKGIRLAYKVANKSYLRGGNNRIILATDGEFPISPDTYGLVAENARQDIFLTVFTFNRKEVSSDSLKKLATLGKGSYEHITAQNADLRLLLEARARKASVKD